MPTTSPQNDKPLTQQLATIEFSHCHRHEDDSESFSYICVSMPCTTCDNRGSRLYCAKCHVKGSNHRGLIELRKYLNDIYYASENKNNVRKNLDQNSEPNASKIPLILNLEKSKSYLNWQKKYLDCNAQPDL